MIALVCSTLPKSVDAPSNARTQDAIVFGERVVSMTTFTSLFGWALSVIIKSNTNKPHSVLPTNENAMDN